MTRPLSAEAIAAEFARLQTRFHSALQTLSSASGVTYGVTPKQEVWRDGKVVLYRYSSGCAPTARVPLLIVYALVNRPYMVDLQHDRSIVKGLLERGQDVYILDWGCPDRADRFRTLDDHVERFLGGAVDYLRQSAGLEAVNLLGICQGGTFALAYAALYPARVRNLVTMVTPVDFHTDDNMLSHWARQLDVDLMVDTLGNVPAAVINACFLALKPWRLLVHKYVAMTDILDDPVAIENFLRMEKWISDSPDQAGESFRQYIRLFYQGNGFVNGGIVIDGREVRLSAVDMPVFNIFAEHDHLVPPSASRALGALVGSRDYSELPFRSGHIGIYVSGRAQSVIPEAIHRWLELRAPDAG